MGSLGLPEIAFIFVLALLIFGPKKLPEIGRTVGKGVAEFRKATNELKRTLNTELVLEENARAAGAPAPPARGAAPRRRARCSRGWTSRRTRRSPGSPRPRSHAAAARRSPAAQADSGTPESR